MNAPRIRNAADGHRTRTGFSLLELLVVIAMIGVLAALILPAVQHVRESARRTQCRNNLRQMGVAFAGYESTRGRLPAGRDAEGDRHQSWCVELLAYLDQSSLAQQYDENLAWNDPANAAVVETDLAVFRCPSAVEDWPGKADYGGNYGSALTGLIPGFQNGYAWEAGLLPPINVDLPGDYRQQAVRMGEIADGSSQTFLVLEDADRAAAEGGLWASGHNCLAHDNGPVNAEISNEIFSRHPGGAHALLGDGSVRMLSEAIDLAVIGGLSTRRNGEVIAP